MTDQLFNYRALVTDVYDGDTITVRLDLGFKISFTEKIRLFGINTPEVRGDEREAGLESRDVLREWILDQEILIQTAKDKKGKYGRYLGVVFKEIDGEWVNINQKLVREGYGKEASY